MATEQEFELIQKRMEAWRENIVHYSINSGRFNKQQMLEHLKAKDEIGAQITEVQMHYLKTLKFRVK